MVYVEDEEIYPVMVALAGCLAIELEAAGTDKPCRVGVKPGAAASLDFGPSDLKQGNGQAWVRLVAASAQWPLDPTSAAIITDTRCGQASAYELEVGVSRCEPQGTTVNNRFIPPTAAEELEAVRLYGSDRRAMKRAILCCLREQLGDDEHEIGLGIYQPLPSEGGVGGGTWQVFIRRS